MAISIREGRNMMISQAVSAAAAFFDVDLMMELGHIWVPQTNLSNYGDEPGEMNKCEPCVRPFLLMHMS